MIKDLVRSCVNCEIKLTDREKMFYIKDPESNGGLDHMGEYLPCCTECYENERIPCFRCRTVYVIVGLVPTVMTDGEEELFCVDCMLHCNTCGEIIVEVTQESWVNDEPYCEVCIYKCEHELSVTLVSRPEHYCDICKSEPGSFYACMNCDYDECEHCHKPKG